MDLTFKSHSFGEDSAGPFAFRLAIRTHWLFEPAEKDIAEVGAGGEGQEGVMPWGEELPSVLLSSFNVVLVETSPLTPQHEDGCERV